MTKLRFSILLATALAGIIAYPFVVSSADTPAVEKKKTIDIAEFEKMELIGWLGQPLGKIVVVEGEIADGTYLRSKADGDKVILLIDTVDGKKLPDKRAFHLSNDDKPKEKSRFKYLGYETGGFTGAPPKLFDYVPAHATTGWGFTTTFWVVRDELKEKSSNK